MRHRKGKDGKYHIAGVGVFELLVGSRAQVAHGTAYKTSYGAVKPRGDALTKKDIKKNKHGRYVSRTKSNKGKSLLKRLHRKGYYTRKGKFGAVRKHTPGKTGRRRGRRKGRGTRKKYSWRRHPIAGIKWEDRGAHGRFTTKPSWRRR